MKKISLVHVLWLLGTLYFGMMVVTALIAGDYTRAGIRVVPLALMFVLLKRLGKSAGVAQMGGGLANIKAGKAADVSADLEQRRAKGDTSLETTMTLSAAYCYQGRGDLAEPLAREAVHALHDKQDKKSRYLADMAYLALADAICLQGRFQDAAKLLESRVEKALRPDFMRLFQVWFYFLADDTAQTLPLLDEIAPGGISPKYRFMLVYLRYKILDDDPALHRYRKEMSKWEDEAERNTANPYGVRLREILDEIHTLI